MANTPCEHHSITFPTAFENYPNQQPNKITRKQIPKQADPELQSNSEDKTCFDLDLELPSTLRHLLLAAQFHGAFVKPTVQSVDHQHARTIAETYGRLLIPLNLPSLKK